MRGAATTTRQGGPVQKMWELLRKIGKISGFDDDVIMIFYNDFLGFYTIKPWGLKWRVVPYFHLPNGHQLEPFQTNYLDVRRIK